MSNNILAFMLWMEISTFLIFIEMKYLSTLLIINL